MENQTKPSKDAERIKAEEKLIEVIDEFLELSDQTINEEDIANSVYHFFSPLGVQLLQGFIRMRPHRPYIFLRLTKR